MFGIIGAMTEEIELIKKEMTNLEICLIGDVEFYKGEINNQKLVLCQSGIGKTNAAFASTVLVHVFKVKGLLFSGVAGGVKPELNIDDLVIGTDFRYHDVDATALGYKISELPDGYLSHFHADKKLSQLVFDIAVQAFGSDKVSQGTILSGDQFIASYDKIKEFQHLYNAYAVDMESTVVAHIANKSDIPCCIIRSISDKADGQAQDIYKEFFTNAAKKSAYIIVKLHEEHSISEILA